MNTNINAKRILCYGDSNTWGWIPLGMGNRRFPINKRWTGILQSKLGTGYEVIEEGLGGRTTVTDDLRPDYPERNGYKSLQGILESHLPVDLIILMLGTTETKDVMNMKAEDITNGLEEVIHLIKNFKTLEKTISPEILIVVPAVIKEDTDFASIAFKNGQHKSQGLIDAYKTLADKVDVDYLNPNQEISVDQNEGVHITAGSHAILADLIYKKVLEIFS